MLTLQLNIAYAFFSPSTLVVMSAAIAVFFKQLIIIIIAFIISIFINLKTKKKYRKKTILIIILIFLLITSILFIAKFKEVKELNTPSELIDGEYSGLIANITSQLGNPEQRKILFSEEYDCDYDSKEKRINKSNEKGVECILFEQYKKNLSIFWNEGHIDLDSATPSHYDTFRVFGINRDEEINLKNSKAIPDYLDLLLNPEHLNIFFSEYKDDKILIYCHGGTSSYILSYILNLLGYNAYFTNLRTVKEDDFINSSMVQELADLNSVLIIPYDANRNKGNLHIDFEDSSARRLFEEIFPDIISYKYKYLKHNMTNETFVRDFSGNLSNNDVLCHTALNCLLTQNLIYSLNMTDEIDYIYYLDIHDI